MMQYPEQLRKVMAFLAHLPGVGTRTSERMGIAMMSWKAEDLAAFGALLSSLKDNVGFCPKCGNYMEQGGKCSICDDPSRQQDIICVVEQVAQIIVIEKSGCFKGIYHVLGGKLSPMSGVGPEDLRIEPLKERLASGTVKELLIATTPDVEGEATANYLAQLFSSQDLLVSRIAAGIPVGADLAFADPATLASAISGRRKI